MAKRPGEPPWPPVSGNYAHEIDGATCWCVTGPSGHATVARLDRNKPPPGMPEPVPLWRLAAAWAHHEERNDPPGLRVSPGECDGEWRVSIVWGLSQDIDGEHDPRRHAGPDAARAAAWAWYWRRVAVAEALDAATLIGLAPTMAYFAPGGSWWPRCLAWSDEEVAEVERWLAEGGEVPEILRG